MPRRPPTPRTKLTTVPRLAVERIAFERDRMALLVRVPEGADASLGTCGADRLLAARPSLAFHTCLNDEDAPFAEVLARTSLPHAHRFAGCEPRLRLRCHVCRYDGMALEAGRFGPCYSKLYR